MNAALISSFVPQVVSALLVLLVQLVPSVKLVSEVLQVHLEELDLVEPPELELPVSI